MKLKNETYGRTHHLTAGGIRGGFPPVHLIGCENVIFSGTAQLFGYD
jgi:hypothetical protein